ncbi:hypothetical protein NA57DRAFT_75848 [Rhizodiscina lignyota]|uniref:MARVEL domain-containing protein n=1 Tax=Rhizodiscina lignyota TaxID=1504668 RepID=A0A9P4IG10_9PEZI|nr:hypothetical protein NA57DRAFT_75848 [Rhizodiscina lignyota]
MTSTTWRPFSILRSGPVPVPQWTLGLRALQALFAIIIIGLLGYSLHYHGGAALQAPCITQIFIAIITLLIILPLTTAIAPFQQRFYDPRTALVLDWFACLFWLASTAALASYLDITSASFGVVNDFGIQGINANFLSGWKTAWDCGVAAAVFGAIEFLLFAIQTLVFAYHYHLFLTNTIPMSSTTVPYGVPPPRRNKVTVSAPQATDPAALEAGVAAPAYAPNGMMHEVHPAHRDVIAPVPPPPPPQGSVLAGAGGGAGGVEKPVSHLPAGGNAAGGMPVTGAPFARDAEKEAAPYPVEGGVL